MFNRRKGKAVLAQPLAMLGEKRRAGEQAEVHSIEVVAEARKRHLGRADSAASSVIPLENSDRPAATREVYRCGKPVMACADDDRIEFHFILRRLSSPGPDPHHAATP